MSGTLLKQKAVWNHRKEATPQTHINITKTWCNKLHHADAVIQDKGRTLTVICEKIVCVIIEMTKKLKFYVKITFISRDLAI